MHGPVSAETLNALLLLDSCSVANAIEALDVRLRNEGFSEPRLCCRFPKDMRRLSGSEPLLRHGRGAVILIEPTGGDIWEPRIYHTWW